MMMLNNSFLCIHTYFIIAGTSEYTMYISGGTVIPSKIIYFSDVSFVSHFNDGIDFLKVFANNTLLSFCTTHINSIYRLNILYLKTIYKFISLLNH
jgi:hypothetical protein